MRQGDRYLNVKRACWVMVQLGCAHRDNNPANASDENLITLCRRCHLAMDAGFHRYTRATRKDKSRPLLQGEECSTSIS